MYENFRFSENKEKLVQEVIDVIDSPNFLLGLPKDKINDFVITDSKEANFYFYIAEYKGFKKKRFYYKWDELIPFSLGSDNVDNLFRKNKPEYDRIYGRIKYFQNMIYEKIKSKKWNEYQSEKIYDIDLDWQVSTDLGEIAKYRALSKRKIKFYEDMLDIYKMGGVPCGWRGGRFPYEGNFLIFSVSDTQDNINPPKPDPNDKYAHLKEFYDFGENFVYIKELFDVVTSDNFLKGSHSFIENEYQTSNVKKAQKIYEKETHYIPSIFPNRIKKLTSTYKLDKTLRDNINNIINEDKLRYKLYEQTSRLLMKVGDIIDSKTNNIQNNRWKEIILCYITTQLDGYIMDRAINGNSNPYYTRMLEAFKTGGWPCGFTGTWPDVKFKVYYPINELANG
jgi:hypothetical protein